MTVHPDALRRMGVDRCRALLAASPVGRVVVSIDALPAAFPVNYVLIGGEIYFRTRPGTKLAAALDRTVVAFQVDSFDAQAASGWSVLVVGPARVVVDPGEVALLDAAGIATWIATPHRHYVAIRMDRVTGRFLQPIPVPAAGTVGATEP